MKIRILSSASQDLIDGFYFYEKHRDNWEAVEAARLLIKHSETTVPLLIDRIGNADAQDIKWLYYALGRCGTPPAVDALKTCALKETNCWWTNAVVYALSLAGERGNAALTDIEKVAEGNLKTSIKLYREGKIGERDQDILFPEVRDVPPLPATVTEMILYHQPLIKKQIFRIFINIMLARMK